MIREASVTRNTKETQISLKLNLDGTGHSDLDTGVGFFDHMLDGFTRHGLFDLDIKVKGDLQVDDPTASFMAVPRTIPVSSIV